MKYRNIRLINSRGKGISCRLYRYEAGNKRLVVFCHGLFSTQDGYKISQMRDDIVSWGFDLLTFDFSYCGESEDILFNLSFEQEIRDLKTVFDYISSTGVDDIHVIGSSMGGTVALVAASREDFLNNKDLLKSLVTMATPVDLCGLVKKLTGIPDMEDIDKQGFTEIEGIAVNNRFFRELCETDPVQSIGSIGVPLLSFHGDADETVDCNNLNLIRDHLNSPGKQVLLRGGDHSLTGSDHINSLKNHIKEWLEGFY